MHFFFQENHGILILQYLDSVSDPCLQTVQASHQRHRLMHRKYPTYHAIFHTESVTKKNDKFLPLFTPYCYDNLNK